MTSPITDEEFNRAAAVLRAGGLIGFPTETYYGLAVDPFNEQALQRLFTVKQRPVAKPVLVLVSARSQIDLLASSMEDSARCLMNRFWPGPLTLVLPARKELSPLLTGGTGTIGIRHSPHPVADRLLRAFGGPLTATSANLSGRPPAAGAGEVAAVLGDQLDMILDGGRTPGREGSTLVGWRGGRIECLREGCISFAEIQACLEEGQVGS